MAAPVFAPGTVAIITGASSGIGAATALKFAELGVSKLCLSGRDLDALKKTERECIEKASNSLVPLKDTIIVQGDLTEESTCEAIVERTVESFGQIDIVVNNAGIIKTGPFETALVSNYDSVMDINVRSVLVLTQLCIPHLKRTRGSIVNVSSVNGIRSFPNVGYYCMSKAALDMFTQCLALELAPDGVRVNAVNPGVVVTNVHKRGAGLNDKEYEAFLERSKLTHPLGRPGSVEEVASSIAFLASSQASFMTGNLTPIDGGRHCLCPR